MANRTLAPLLKEAVTQKLLKDAGFRHLPIQDPANSYSKSLVSVLPDLRNSSAHASTNLPTAFRQNARRVRSVGVQISPAIESRVPTSLRLARIDSECTWALGRVIKHELLPMQSSIQAVSSSARLRSSGEPPFIAAGQVRACQATSPYARGKSGAFHEPAP